MRRNALRAEEILVGGDRPETWPAPSSTPAFVEGFAAAQLRVDWRCVHERIDRKSVV